MPSEISSLPQTKNVMDIWLLYHYGGPPYSSRFERQIEVARALKNDGTSVTVFFSSFHHLSDGTFEVDEVDGYGVRYFPVPCRKYVGNGLGRVLNMLDFWRGMCRFSKGKVRDGPDVVIASTPHPFVWFAAERLRRKFGAKLILEVRDLWPESIVEVGGIWKYHPIVLLFGGIMRRAYRSCDMIVSVLPGSESYFISKIRPESAVPMFTIPNGVSLSRVDAIDTRILPQVHTEKLEELQNSGRLLVGYAGAMGKPNAMTRVIELQEYIDRTGLDVSYKLIFVGDGHYRDKLKKLSTECKNPVFEVLPSLRKNEVPSFLNRLDAGLVMWLDSPIYRYGVSPNKVWEYFSMSLPVVWVGKTGYNPVEDAKGGLSTVSSKPEAFHKLLEELSQLSKTERINLGAQGRRYVEKKGDWRILGGEYRGHVFSLVGLNDLLPKN